MQKNH